MALSGNLLSAPTPFPLVEIGQLEFILTAAGPDGAGRYVIEPAPRPEASLDRRWRAATRNPR